MEEANEVMEKQESDALDEWSLHANQLVSELRGQFLCRSFVIE